MRLFSLVVRNLLRRRVRTLLTVCGVSVAIGSVVALLGVADGFQRSFIDLFRTQAIDLIVIRAGRFQAYTAALDERLGPRIRAIPGVRDLSSGLMEVVSFEELDLYGVPVQALDPDSFRFDSFDVKAGRRLRRGDRKGIMLGRIIARNLDKNVGDVVEVVEDEPFEVIGIYESFNVYDNGTIVMLLSELQEMMDRPSQVSGFSVRVNDPGDRAALDRICEEIEALGEGVSAVPADEYVHTIGQIRLARNVAWLISVVALVIGVLGMLNTMAMSVMERTGEIGVLRALGWPRWRIVRMILIESEAISLAGAAVGSVVAVLLVSALSRLPTTSGLIDGRVAPQIVGLGVLIAVGVGLIGGSYSAFLAARMMPTRALRHE